MLLQYCWSLRLTTSQDTLSESARALFVRPHRLQATGESEACSVCGQAGAGTLRCSDCRYVVHSRLVVRRAFVMVFSFISATSKYEDIGACG